VHIDQPESHFSRKKSRTAQAIEYFQINPMAKDPFEDYAERKELSLSLEETERWLASNRGD
jgi:hypothetical protein